MNFLHKTRLIALPFFFLVAIAGTALSQQTASPYPKVEPDRFDYGKMWTFEYAPIQYFTETYGFKPDEKWFEHARMSALRFSSYCSASFISPDGLVMTNHHCSRGEVGKVMREGEDFDKTGFYAATLADERRVEGLYVKQLVKIADITEAVSKVTATAKSDAMMVTMRDSTLKALRKEYSSKAEWAGLELETVNYYNGGRFSMYGYKRYDDVRLVLIPELQLGFFGGDPDNFTYPRYNLDCTLWRIYDDGKPLNSSNFYFKFNDNGIKDGEPVFVIGNPGSTERYRTVSQLEYDRDYRYKIQLTQMRNRYQLMAEEYAKNPSHELQEEMFGMSNGIKAIGGIVEGMHDPQLMGRKQGMENRVKAQSKAFARGEDYWSQMANEYEALKPHAAEVSLLAPSPLGGAALLLMHYTEAYMKAMEGGAGEEDLKALRDQIRETAKELSKPGAEKALATLLTEIQQFADPSDQYVAEIFEGKSPAEVAANLLKKTDFTDEGKLEKLLGASVEKLRKQKDPLLAAGRLLVPAYQKSAGMFRSSSPKRRALDTKIGHEIYQVFGLNIPPDATFTLRISDGVVKSYGYNGTEAPIKTTYAGMYDRHYSFDGQFPWGLPDRWLNNPSSELLRAPMNFISTNDIIGGNSGSPIINKYGQAVGLVFDGNIESLPGNFIYDTKVNRAVSVHAGGISAALKHIYKADRILKELGL